MMEIASLLVLSFLALAIGFAPMAGAAPAQQNKMNAGNPQANEKGFSEGKGDERKAFMKECLSAKPATDGKTAQQNKMKTCNKEAGDKKLSGDERKKFMSSCLSN